MGVAALLAANDLSSRAHIFPGQVLHVPAPGEPRERVAPTLVASANVNAATLARPRAAPAKVPIKAAPTLAAPERLPNETPAAAQPVAPQTPPPAEALAAGEAPAEAASSVADPAPPEGSSSELAPAEPAVSFAEVASSGELSPADPPAARGAGSEAPASSAAPEGSNVPEVSAESPWRRIENESVMVDSLETLGHYADWLEIPVDHLRKLNKLAPGRRLRLGQRVLLDFAKVSRDVFVERRLEYHKNVEEDFFGSWRVTGTEAHQLRRGESLWLLAQKSCVAG